MQRISALLILVTLTFIAAVNTTYAESSMGIQMHMMKATPSGTISPTPSVLAEKLDKDKLHICEHLQNAIENRSEGMSKMSSQIGTHITNIATRVEQFYTNVVVPAGETVPNYSTLVANIQTQKAVVDAAVTAAQTDMTNFTCSGDNPKGQLILFKNDMLKVIAALKDYRTSVKNLIVAVAQVAETLPTPTEKSETTEPSSSVTESEQETHTPTPTSSAIPSITISVTK